MRRGPVTLKETVRKHYKKLSQRDPNQDLYDNCVWYYFVQILPEDIKIDMRYQIWFQIQIVGFRTQDFRFRIQDLGYKIQDQELGFGIQTVGFWIRTQDLGFKVWIQDLGSQDLGSQDSGISGAAGTQVPRYVQSSLARRVPLNRRF